MVDSRIMHLDMDAFFAAVEMLDNPDLMGRPVVVGGMGPRGVVAACSYEARASGVHSAMPMARARRLCPDAVVAPARKERYQEISRDIFAFLEARLVVVEKTSVDEGYMDVSDRAGSDEEACALGGEVKEEIRRRFGLVCSIGIAPCKFVAKIASDLEKPDALVVVGAEGLLDFLGPLDVKRIPGVGQVGRRKLAGLHIETIGDLRKQSRDFLVHHFGKWGHRLFEFARGIDTRVVGARGERKSLGREQTFARDVVDVALLRERLLELAGVVAAHLEKSGLWPHTVVIKVRYGNFESITRQISFGNPVRERNLLYEIACELLKDTEAGRRPVRLIGLSVSGFQPPASTPDLPFFC